MFKVGIFVCCKDNKEKLVKWLPESYSTHEAADAAVEKKNKDLKVDPRHVSPGTRFAMYDSV